MLSAGSSIGEFTAKLYYFNNDSKPASHKPDFCVRPTPSQLRGGLFLKNRK
jgi:hypothetical protein